MHRFKLLNRFHKWPLARHPIYAQPRPLILHDQKMILSWSAKSGSVQILMWYLIQVGLLEAAKAYSLWVHDYRMDILHASDAYQIWARGITVEGTSSYTLVKFFRDPMERCVSAYRHALRSGYVDAPMEQVLGRPVNHRLGYSFRQFLDYLTSIDLRGADPHHKLQRNNIDGEKFGKKLSINVDNTSFYEALNQLEKEFYLKPTDFGKVKDFKVWANLHHATDASQTYEGDDLFDRKLTLLDAEMRWPKDHLGHCEEAHDRVRDIYRLDYAVAEDFTVFPPHAHQSNPQQESQSTRRPSRALSPAQRLTSLGKNKLFNAFDASLDAAGLAPHTSLYHYHRANSLADQKRFDRAEDYFRKAINRDPDWAKYHVRLAECLEQAARPDDAIEAMQSAVNLEPGSALLHHDLGLLYAGARKFEQALRALNTAIEMQPAYGHFHHQAARVLNSMGRLDDAICAARQAVCLKPGSAQFHHFLGNLLLSGKQYSKALTEHSTAIEIEPSRAAYHNSLSRALGGLGRFDDAIKSARQAVSIEPDKASWQTYLDHLIHAGTPQ